PLLDFAADDFLGHVANLGGEGCAGKRSAPLAASARPAYLTSRQCDKRAIRADHPTLWPSMFEECYRSSSQGISLDGRHPCARTPKKGPRFCFLSVTGLVSRTQPNAYASTNKSALVLSE